MMWLRGAKPWSLEKSEGSDLEELVASWTARQESSAWVTSALVLGMLLAAMVLFAIIR